MFYIYHCIASNESCVFIVSFLIFHIYSYIVILLFVHQERTYNKGIFEFLKKKKKFPEFESAFDVPRYTASKYMCVVMITKKIKINTKIGLRVFSHYSFGGE